MKIQCVCVRERERCCFLLYSFETKQRIMHTQNNAHYFSVYILLFAV